MKVAVVYDPDPALGPDPKDGAAMPRRLGDFLDGDRLDVMLIWRELGEQYEGGSRTHVIGTGIWENVSHEQIQETLGALFDDGLGE